MSPLSASVITDTTKYYKTHNTCCYKSVTTYPFANRKFIIDYPPETYTYSKFSLNPAVCTDQVNSPFDQFPFWYKRESTPLIPVRAIEPIYFHDFWDLKFKVETSDPTTAGIYTIVVSGYLPNHQLTQSAPFTIELFNIPPGTTITPRFI